MYVLTWPYYSKFPLEVCKLFKLLGWDTFQEFIVRKSSINKKEWGTIDAHWCVLWYTSPRRVGEVGVLRPRSEAIEGALGSCFRLAFGKKNFSIEPRPQGLNKCEHAQQVEVVLLTWSPKCSKVLHVSKTLKLVTHKIKKAFTTLLLNILRPRF